MMTLRLALFFIVSSELLCDLHITQPPEGICGNLGTEKFLPGGGCILLFSPQASTKAQVGEGGDLH